MIKHLHLFNWHLFNWHLFSWFLAFAVMSCSLMILPGCGGKGIRPAESIIEDGWARVAKEDSESEPPLYCYRTIGDVQCYTTPDERRSNQLVSVYPIHKNPSAVNKVRDRYGMKVVRSDLKDPSMMTAQEYEAAMAASEFAPTYDQKTYQERSNAYLAAQDQVEAGKVIDDRLFAREEAAKKEKQRLLVQKEKAKQEAREAPQEKRTVTQILQVLRGEKPASALEHNGPDVKANKKSLREKSKIMAQNAK